MNKIFLKYFRSSYQPNLEVKDEPVEYYYSISGEVFDVQKRRRQEQESITAYSWKEKRETILSSRRAKKDNVVLSSELVSTEGSIFYAWLESHKQKLAALGMKSQWE